MSKPMDQLNAVAEQFEQWRQSKENVNSAAPLELRRQVVALVEHFTVAHIKDTLNLSSSALYRWINQFSVAAPDTKKTATVKPLQTPEFVALSTDEPFSTSGITLELSVGENCHVRLSGDISTAQLDIVTRNIFMFQNGVGA